MTGKFITLEGSEGAGKSSAMRAILDWANNKSVCVTQTREPGGTPEAEAIRTLLLDKNQHWDDQAELLLVMAARQQHVAKLIQPALQKGDWVISDRFADATYAYQGGGRGLDLTLFQQFMSQLGRAATPDLTLLLDVDAETGLKRALKNQVADRFEQEQLSFFQRVREAYLKRANAEPHRIKIIDANQPQEAVLEQIEYVLQHFWEQVARD